MAMLSDNEIIEQGLPLDMLMIARTMDQQPWFLYDESSCKIGYPSILSKVALKFRKDDRVDDRLLMVWKSISEERNYSVGVFGPMRRSNIHYGAHQDQGLSLREYDRSTTTVEYMLSHSREYVMLDAMPWRSGTTILPYLLPFDEERFRDFREGMVVLSTTHYETYNPTERGDDVSLQLGITTPFDLIFYWRDCINRDNERGTSIGYSFANLASVYAYVYDDEIEDLIGLPMALNMLSASRKKMTLENVIEMTDLYSKMIRGIADEQGRDVSEIQYRSEYKTCRFVDGDRILNASNVSTIGRNYHRALQRSAEMSGYESYALIPYLVNNEQISLYRRLLDDSSSYSVAGAMTHAGFTTAFGYEQLVKERILSPMEVIDWYHSDYSFGLAEKWVRAGKDIEEAEKWYQVGIKEPAEIEGAAIVDEWVDSW